jgi:hypothetical protein
VELRSGLLREIARPPGIAIGDRKEGDGGVFGGKPRPQAADAPGADDADTECFAFDGASR